MAILIARMTNATRREAGSLTLHQATRELEAARRVQASPEMQAVNQIRIF